MFCPQLLPLFCHYQVDKSRHNTPLKLGMKVIYFSFVFWDRASLCTLSWPQTQALPTSAFEGWEKHILIMRIRTSEKEKKKKTQIIPNSIFSYTKTCITINILFFVPMCMCVVKYGPLVPLSSMWQCAMWACYSFDADMQFISPFLESSPRELFEH